MAKVPSFRNGKPVMIEGVPGHSEDCACCGEPPYNWCECTCGEYRDQVDRGIITITDFYNSSCPPTSVSECPGIERLYASMNGQYFVELGTPLEIGTFAEFGDPGILIETSWGWDGEECRPIATYLYIMHFHNLRCEVDADTYLACSVDIWQQTFYSDTGEFIFGSVMTGEFGSSLGASAVWSEVCNGTGDGVPLTSDTWFRWSDRCNISGGEFPYARIQVILLCDGTCVCPPP